MPHPEHTESTGHQDPHNGKHCIMKVAATICCLYVGIATHAQQALAKACMEAG